MIRMLFGKLLRKLKISEMSILTKLILTFLILFTPLYGAALLLNENGRKEVSRQISNNMTNQLHNYVFLLESEITRIHNLQKDFTQDLDLKYLSGLERTMTNYERTQTINRLSSRVILFKTASEYIKEVTVFMPLADRTISSVRSFNEYKPGPEMLELFKRQEYPLVYRENRVFISPLVANYTSMPQYIILVELNTEYLKDVLSSFNQNGGTILFQNDWKITSRGQEHTDDYLGLKEFRQAVRSLDHSETFSAEMNETNFFFALEHSDFLDTSILIYSPQEHVLGALKINKIWIWLLTGITVLLIVLFAYGIYLLIHIPFKKLVKVFHNIEEGDFSVSIRYHHNDEFGYLYHRFAVMVSRLKYLIDESYVQKIRLQQSEYKQLQNQVNPHFLYNSFFILKGIIANQDNENAMIFCNYLGDYYQYVTRNAQAEMPLIREYNHARAYLEIQKMRFFNRIEVEIDELPEKYHQLMVPRLLLQPCIENAYQHGLSEKIKDGLIRIKCREYDSQLCISIEDNGGQLDADKLSKLEQSLQMTDEPQIESTGLINVHRRLQLKFGRNSGVRVSRGEMGGLKVDIYIS